MQRIIIDVQDGVLDKVMYLLRNLRDIHIVQENSKNNSTEEDGWEYWTDSEIDNFGKIAIGLSKHEYDDEDYSQW